MTNQTPDTLGQIIGFKFTIEVQDDEVIPVQNATLEIYNSALPGTYHITCTNLPLTATTRVYSTSGGQVTITASPEPSGVHYGYVHGPTSMTYSTSWASPSTWPTGQHVIKVTLAADGTTFEQARTVTLASTPAPTPNFTMEAGHPQTGSPTTSGEVGRGEEIKLAISVKAVEGFTGKVTLSASGLPEETTATFDPASGTPDFTSDLTISTGKKTKPGTYELAFKATSNGLSHTLTYTLEVTAKRMTWLGVLLLVILIFVAGNVLYILLALTAGKK